MDSVSTYEVVEEDVKASELTKDLKFKAGLVKSAPNFSAFCRRFESRVILC